MPSYCNQDVLLNQNYISIQSSPLLGKVPITPILYHTIVDFSSMYNTIFCFALTESELPLSIISCTVYHSIEVVFDCHTKLCC